MHRIKNILLPRDIIALTTLIGSFILLALGKNEMVAYFIISIISFYFGSEIFQQRKRKS